MFCFNMHIDSMFNKNMLFSWFLKKYLDSESKDLLNLKPKAIAMVSEHSENTIFSLLGYLGVDIL